jgi:hypothetical protein
MAKKSRVVKDLSGPHSEMDPVRFLCMIETLYLHPMILGHFVQSGLRLGLLGCGLSPLGNCNGSSIKGKAGGGGSVCELSVLDIRCD